METRKYIVSYSCGNTAYAPGIVWATSALNALKKVGAADFLKVLMHSRFSTGKAVACEEGASTGAAVFCSYTFGEWSVRYEEDVEL